jgi:hypothetical protein
MKEKFIPRDSQTFGELIRRFDHYTSDKDFCEQCRRPWHDGICTCGNFNDFRVQIIMDLAYRLMNEGKDLSRC